MCNEEKKWSFPFNPLHLIYCIIILVMVIIAIFSYFFSEDSNLASLIAFAATIASIILSVLAIFMTILSNNSIGGMLHKVRDMHDSVVSIPDTLNKSVAELKETTTGLMHVNTEVNKAITSFGNKLEDLESHISQNENKIDEMLNRFSSINTVENNPEKPTAPLIKQYLNMLSLNGLFLLYGFGIYQEKQKTGVFSIDAFAKCLFVADPAYLHGVLVASGSASILFYNTIEETNNMDIINLSLSPHITKETISSRIDMLCADISERYKELSSHYDANARKQKIIGYVESIS